MYFSLSKPDPGYIPSKSKRNVFKHAFKSKETMLQPKVRDTTKRNVTHDRNLPAYKPNPKKPKPPTGERPPRKHNGKARKSKKGSGAARTPNRGTQANRDLRKLHFTKALRIGTVQGCMKNQGFNEQEAKAVQDHLFCVLQLLREIQRRVYWAFALWVDNMKRESLASLDDSVNEALDEPGFMTGLMRLLYEGTSHKSKAYDKHILESPDSLPPEKPSDVHAYDLFLSATGLPALSCKEEVKGLVLARAFDMMGVTVRTSLRSHYRNALVRRQPEHLLVCFLNTRSN